MKTPRQGRGVTGQSGINAGGEADEALSAWDENGDAERAADGRGEETRRKQGTVRRPRRRRAANALALHIADLCIEQWSPASRT